MLRDSNNPNISLPADEQWLARAITLAENGRGHTRPNPPVGALLVAGNKCIGEGWHHKAGLAHAEVEAIREAKHRAPEAIKGSTLYVSLEPCSKPGRVGACTDAIREAGISRVVYAMHDPNPVNRGGAARVLSAANIICSYPEEDSPIASRAKELLMPFTKHVQTGLPFVTVKLAMSLDGQICDKEGDAKWISSSASREKTGLLRTQVDAILVGAETVRKDNPSLLSHGEPNPDLIRVIISKSGRLPKDAQVFTDGQNETLVFDDAEKALRALGARGCLHVLCEGGFQLARSLADAGCVDEWITVLAPCVIGHQPLASARQFKGEDYVYRTYSKNWNR